MTCRARQDNTGQILLLVLLGIARDNAARAKDALDLGMTPDALLTAVEAALEALGELTGRTVREDITARIFSRFCVGK